MEKRGAKNIKYLNVTALDEAWGVVVTTVGYQLISPNSNYPQSEHPSTHEFHPSMGRTLSEYQLIYISEGSGFFESQSYKQIKIEKGTVIMLFPNEWHTYRPSRGEGWFEYWVGFKGELIDKKVEQGLLSKENPIYKVGSSASIISCFENIVHYAQEERSGQQLLTSGIIFHLLGLVLYKHKNNVFANSAAQEKINRAKNIMRQEIESPRSPKLIAEELGVSYSWFRQMFKEYTDISPIQYQLRLKFLQAKELLERTDMTVSEIAYRLSFESVSQFCSFFRKNEGLSPARYRNRLNGTNR